MRNFGIPPRKTTLTVELRFRLRWWVLPYLRLMDHLDRQCGVRVDPDRVQARVLKGTLIVTNGVAKPLRS